MIKKLKLLTIAAALVLVVASPADAREFASFMLSVYQGESNWGGPVTASTQIKKKMTQVEVPQGMSLDISFFQVIGGGTACFPDTVDYEGWFVVRENRGSPRAEFYFKAFGKDSSPGHKYVLHLNGVFLPDDNFPPSEGSTATMYATDWEMSTEGKGQDRHNTCTGDDEFRFEAEEMVRVTVTRTG
jgi:hypothetical protein